MLENCRWLLYASRFYGCHPHTIREEPLATSTATPPRFRPLMLYSALACSVYCVFAYFSSGMVECTPKGAMIVGCALQKVDRFTRGLYMILTTLLSCLRHAHFERAVAIARKFDDLVRHHRRRVDIDLVNRRTQWLALLGIHVAYTLLCIYLKYVLGRWLSMCTIMIQAFTRAAFSTQVVKFCFLYDALRRRFCLVNRLCRESRPGTAASTLVQRVAVPAKHYYSNHHVLKVIVGAHPDASGSHDAEFTIVHLQRLHRCLSDATNCLSAHYSPQLLCWLVCLLVDIMMYSFFTIYTGLTRDIIIFQSLLLMTFSVQIVALSRFCHLTCDQANSLARMMFSTETGAFRKDEFLADKIEFGVYLRAQPLRIRVFDLFDLDNRFPLLVFGVILMYVILASNLQ